MDFICRNYRSFTFFTVVYNVRNVILRLHELLSEELSYYIFKSRNSEGSRCHFMPNFITTSNNANYFLTLYSRYQSAVSYKITKIIVYDNYRTDPNGLNLFYIYCINVINYIQWQIFLL